MAYSVGDVVDVPVAGRPGAVVVVLGGHDPGAVHERVPVVPARVGRSRILVVRR